MAIVKLKYVEIGASRSSYKEMLVRASKCDYLHAELASKVVDKTNGERLMPLDNRYLEAINQLRNLSIQTGHSLVKKEDFTMYSNDMLYEKLAKLDLAIKEIAPEQKLTMNLTRDDELAMDIVRNLNYNKLHHTMFMRFIMCRLTSSSYSKLKLLSHDLFKISELHSNKDKVWIILATTASYYEEVVKILSDLFYEEIQIPHFDVSSQVAEYEDEINNIYSYCLWRNDLRKLYKYVKLVDGRYVVSGFAPENKIEELKQLYSDIDVYITVDEVKEETRETEDSSIDPKMIANGLDKIDFDKIGSLTFLTFKFGVITNNAYEKLRLYDESLFRVYDLGEKNIYHWVAFVTTKDLYKEVRKIFDSLDFREINLEQTKFKELMSRYQKASSDEERNEIFAEQISDSDLTIQVQETKVIKAPTLLKNNKFSKPFEMFVDMYGTPNYYGVDPTLLVSITYTILYGMMFGDFGHGLCLVVLGFYGSYKNNKSNLFKIIKRIGFSSMFFGFLYGSFFGIEDFFNPIHRSLFNVPDKLFEVMASESTMIILGSALAIGALLIVISMIINMFIKVKNRELGELLFSQNGVTGLVFYLFLLFALVGVMTATYNAINPITEIIFIIVPLLIFLLEQPLSSLIEGQGFKPQGSWGDFAIEAPIELFEVCLNFLANTMSYLRVGGFVLSHAGMMLVVMTLVEMTGNAGFIVFVLGNIFVMALEGLIVGIQVLRLELYEMFSRYFYGGGHKFEKMTEYK